MMKPFARKQPNSREILREGQRDLTHATRGVEKEITSLQKEEKKLIAEIKRTAKTGNEAAMKMLARQLVRLRQQIVKLQSSRVQMRGIATHMQVTHANASVATGMKGAAKAMGAINKQVAPEKHMKTMQNFQRQSAQMDMTSETMADFIDDVLDDDELTEETDQLTNEVLDSIGVDISTQLASVPKGKIAVKKDEASGSQDINDLEKRLETLRSQ